MDHIMMESLNECVLCGCYSDYFVTGNTEEVIGKYIFSHGWHGYNPPTDDERDLHEALRQIAINNTRRELGIKFAHGAIAVGQL